MFNNKTVVIPARIVAKSPATLLLLLLLLLYTIGLSSWSIAQIINRKLVLQGNDFSPVVVTRYKILH